MSYSGIDSQYDATPGYPLEFNIANFSNYPVAGPSNPGITDQLQMQGLIPELGLGYTLMQPALTVLPYREGSNPSQLLSTSGPSYTGFADLSNDTLVGTSTSGVTDQLEMQGLPVTPRLDQTYMQSAVRELPYTECSNQAQPILTSNVLQKYHPIPDQSIAANTRKRPRSPKPFQEQQLSAINRTLSRQTGVPEVSLNTFSSDRACSNLVPATKRTRTSLQKRNKKDVGDAGGACLLCRITKKQVFLCRPFRRSIPIRY